MSDKIKIKKNFFKQINGLHRLFICLALAVLILLLSQIWQMDFLSRVLTAWDIFAISMLSMSWIIFITTESMEIRQEVKDQDPNRLISFSIILVSALSSLLAVLILLSNKNNGVTGKNLNTLISLLGMVLSWFLVHTIFAFRYGHLYYGDDKEKPEIHAAGLEFPGRENPDYLDFAYFSFVIGMTFQVSDVEISAQNLRRLVLFHGIISFGFNTVIVALSISVIAGLIQ